MVSGMMNAHLMPRAAQTMARPMPVLPLVGSSTMVSGLIRPCFSSASTIDTPMRSFTLCAGLKYSSLHAMEAHQRGIADQLGRVLGDAHERLLVRLAFSLLDAVPGPPIPRSRYQAS